MNFNPISSSDSSDDEILQLIDSWDLEQLLIIRQIRINNELIELLQNANHTHGGSRRRRRKKFRDRETAAANLFNDYFSENPTFNEENFRMRFRMSRTLFLRIVNAVKEHDGYFVQRRNAAGKFDLSTLQKVVAAFRILADAVSTDSTDEYIKIGESTSIECVKRFCRAVVEIFGEQYLRMPTPDDVSRLLRIGKQRGFPGMLGSLGCMHWRWNNSPIIFEVVADYDMWIWHAYVGISEFNNDITVLETSHLISDLARGTAPVAHYVIQENTYNMGYYLADNNYPKWATLVHTIYAPSDPKKSYFAMKQETCKKDVERAFGVLRSRFTIVANPTRFWSTNDLHDITAACIIMHNMIIEDERDLDAPIREVSSANLEFVENEQIQSQVFRSRFGQSEKVEGYFALQNALIDHLSDECSK